MAGADQQAPKERWGRQAGNGRLCRSNGAVGCPRDRPLLPPGAAYGNTISAHLILCHSALAVLAGNILTAASLTMADAPGAVPLCPTQGLALFLRHLPTENPGRGLVFCQTGGKENCREDYGFGFAHRPTSLCLRPGCKHMVIKNIATQNLCVPALFIDQVFRSTRRCPETLHRGCVRGLGAIELFATIAAAKGSEY